MIPGEYECGRDFRMRQVNSSSCKWEGVRKLGMHDRAVYGDDVKAAKKKGWTFMATSLLGLGGSWQLGAAGDGLGCEL